MHHSIGKVGLGPKLQHKQRPMAGVGCAASLKENETAEAPMRLLKLQCRLKVGQMYRLTHITGSTWSQEQNHMVLPHSETIDSAAINF